MKNRRFQQLLERWKNDQLNDQEKSEWMQLLIDPELAVQRESFIGDSYENLPVQHVMIPEEADALFDGIVQGPTSVGTTNRRFYYLHRYTAAAAVIGIVVIAGILWWQKDNHQPHKSIIANVYKNDVKPGSSHAVLTLANGAKIMLDTAGQGTLGSQGGARIVKVNLGSLSYKSIASNDSQVYNTVSTPSGGQYQITLADGTVVWLNALSAIRFPTSFSGRERKVELTGEAYFEIARNADKPFHVTVGGMEVAVLGTAFNVNAYSDEISIRTTLLQGSVMLVRGIDKLLLKPGEQGQTTGSTGLTVVKDADVDQAVAWKKGFFSFEDANIGAVMRQLERWYGIEVRYDGPKTSASFGGKMGRDLNLTQVLKGLEQSGVHFRLEGNLLTVLP